MTNPISRAVLMTGCSTGIGRATAELLAGRGFLRTQFRGAQ